MNNNHMIPERLAKIQALADAGRPIHITDVKVLLTEVRRLTAELSSSRKAFAKLYGNRQTGISPNVFTCPVCGGCELITLVQRWDAPELFVLTCGECGSHATIQLFADPDEIARLTAQLSAEKKRADKAVELTKRIMENKYEPDKIFIYAHRIFSECGPCVENAPEVSK